MRCTTCQTLLTSRWEKRGPSPALICPVCGTSHAVEPPYARLPQICPLEPAISHSGKQRRLLAVLAASVVLSGFALWHALQSRSNPSSEPLTLDQSRDARRPQAELPPQDGRRSEERPAPALPNEKPRTPNEFKEESAKAEANKPDSKPEQPKPVPQQGEEREIRDADSETHKPHPADGSSRESLNQAAESGGDAPGQSESDPSDGGKPSGPQGKSTSGPTIASRGVPVHLPPVLFVKQAPVLCLALSRDGQTLATGHSNGTVRLQGIGVASAETSTIESPGGAPMSLAFHPGGKLLGVLFEKRLDLFELPGRIRRVSVDSRNCLSCFAWSADGIHLAIGEKTGDAVVRALPDLRIVNRMPGYGGVLSMAWSGLSQRFAVATVDNFVRLWEPGRTATPQELVGHVDWVLAMADIPESPVLATGSWDATLRIWDLHSLTTCGVLRGHETTVTAVGASPSGELLASGDANGGVKIWDARNGSELKTFRIHFRRVTGIEFLDRQRVITVSEDGSAKSIGALTGVPDALSGKRPQATADRPQEDPRVELAAAYATAMQDAHRLVEQQLYQQAADAYRAAAKLRPLYGEPYLQLGDCLLALDDPSDAIDAFRQAAKLQPDSGWSLYRLGIALAKSKQNGEAIETLRNACNLLPDNVAARMLLGRLLLDGRQFASAQSEFQEAVALSPKSHEAVHGLAAAHAALHQWYKAIELYKQIVETKPDYGPAYSGLIDAILNADPRRAREAHGWAEVAQQQGIKLLPGTAERLRAALQHNG